MNRHNSKAGLPYCIKLHRGRRRPDKTRGAIGFVLNFFGYFLFLRKESDKTFMKSHLKNSYLREKESSNLIKRVSSMKTKCQFIETICKTAFNEQQLNLSIKAQQLKNHQYKSSIKANERNAKHSSRQLKKYYARDNC